MLVVFGVHFSTLVSENCSLILSSQTFPPESSSQFSTQTTHWDLLHLHINDEMNLQLISRMEKFWPTRLDQQIIKYVWPNLLYYSYSNNIVEIHLHCVTTLWSLMVDTQMWHWTQCSTSFASQLERWRKLVATGLHSEFEILGTHIAKCLGA